MQNIVKKAMLVVLSIAFLSPLTFSQPGEGWNLKRLESQLNLTDGQKDQVEKLRIEHQKSMVDLKAKLEKTRIELSEVMNKDDFTRSEYLAAHNKMTKFREDIQLAAANHRMDILDLMNKDQRKILAKERKFEKRQKYFNRKGWGGCDFDCPQYRERKRIHW